MRRRLETGSGQQLMRVALAVICLSATGCAQVIGAAISSTAQALTQAPRAMGRAAAASSRNRPEVPRTHRELCEEALQYDEPKVAQPECFAAVRESDSARDWVNFGRYAQSRGNFEDARQSYINAHIRDELYAPALRGLGEVALEQNDPKAGAWLRRALEQDPKDRGLRLSLADALVREGELSQAERELNELLELRPNWGAALRVLGDLKKAKGELQASLEAYRRCVQYDGLNERCVQGAAALSPAANKEALRAPE